MISRKGIDLTSYDIDANYTVKPSTYLRHMQQLARDDIESMGITYEGLRNLGMVFVMVKLVMNIYKPLRCYDVIDIETWPKSIKGAGFLRDFQVFQDNELIADASTMWVIMDFENRRLLRPSKFPYEIKGEDRDTGIELFQRLQTTESAEEIGSRQIYFSDLDYNLHLNNTVYADIVTDFLPNPIGNRITSLQLSFQNEATMGDTLNILRAAEGNCRFYFKGVNVKEGVCCFEASICTESVKNI